MVRVVDWQDELKMKMMESAQASNARMRKMWGGSSWERQAISRENGAQGGRPKAAVEPKPTPKPKPKPKLTPLSDKARIVNKLLLKDWIIVDIADVLGVSHQAVSQMVQRYNLPRKED